MQTPHFIYSFNPAPNCCSLPPTSNHFIGIKVYIFQLLFPDKSIESYRFLLLTDFAVCYNFFFRVVLYYLAVNISFFNILFIYIFK